MGIRLSQLDETEQVNEAAEVDEDDRICRHTELGEAEQGGWLEGDDIEDF